MQEVGTGSNAGVDGDGGSRGAVAAAPAAVAACGGVEKGAADTCRAEGRRENLLIHSRSRAVH
jgi:hypothetical protein